MSHKDKTTAQKVQQAELFTVCTALEQLTTAIMYSATEHTLQGVLTARQDMTQSENAFWYLHSNYELLSSAIAFARHTAQDMINYLDAEMFPLEGEQLTASTAATQGA